MKTDKKNKNILFESDWLASEPYFYSTETGTSSLNINDVIDSIGVKSLDAEGTYNFLDFGYSVFNQTPVSGVKFLPPASKLIKNKNGLFEVETKTDPINQWLEYSLKEKEIIELIRHRVQSWEASLPSDQEIVLPLSGGFDSRLLLWCISDKSRIRAFTYGISNEQVLSTEVVHARALAKTFDIRWEQIELGNFHRFLPNWYAKFGISTHAHGMYQQEFYEKIRNRLQGRKFALLSGIVGDIWAGSVPFKKINSPIDINKLGNTHGQVSKADKLKSKFQHNLRNEFWELNKKSLQEHRFQTITSIRFKLILLNYLLKVPRQFGFQSWSPFLDIDIAMAMVNLPTSRRKDRVWQRDFFVKEGLDLESKGLLSIQTNSLDFQAQKNYPVPSLDCDILSDVFNTNYIKSINNRVRITRATELQSYLLSIPRFHKFFRKIGLRKDLRQQKAYTEYMYLKPIQEFLRK